ncbi:MAG: hypothetical protein LUD47_05750 [Clostridia bacterium]|nr:hypothetical protein [Clostridia bacterium]
MLTVHVTSNKTKEKIDKCFESDNFHEEQKDAINEALDYADGNARNKSAVRTRCIPDTDIYSLREKLGMTQNRFTHILGVPQRLLNRGNPGGKSPRIAKTSCIF